MKYLTILLAVLPLALSSQPLFQLRTPKETGVQFINTIQEKPGANVLEYEYFYNGGGVAAGDLNNDGKTDLVFTANDGPVKVYFNQGNWIFKEVTTSANLAAITGWKTGVTLADVNADGWLDIYISRSGNVEESLRRNLLYINQKNGTFLEQAKKFGIDDAGCSTQAAFFDYDLDGDLDLYVLNHPIRRFSNFDVEFMKQARDTLAGDRLYRNDGIVFTPVTLEAGISGNPISFGLGLAILDFNNDGWPDIYVSNDYDEDDYLYINQQNGTFKDNLPQILGHTSKFSMGNDAGDINNDGLIDFLTLDMLPADNKRQKLLKGPDGYDHFQMLLSHGYYHQYMRNMLHLNRGNGTFAEIGQLAGISNTDWSWTPLFADYDLDGWQDLFITNGYMRDYTNMDFLNYTAPEEIRKARQAGQSPDLYALVQKMPSSGARSYVFRNTGTLQFEDVTQTWGMGKPALSHGAAYADLDSDGDLDLIVNNTNQPAFLWENKAETLKNNYLTIKLSGNTKNTFGVGAKVLCTASDGFQQLHELTPSRGFQSAVEPKLTIGLGKRKFVDIQVTWPGGARQTLQQVEVNQTLLIKQENARPSTSSSASPKANQIQPVDTKIDFIHFEDDFNDFKREPLLPHQFSKEGPALATADLNGDGKTDVFVGGAAVQVGAIYLNQGNQTFKELYQPVFNSHSKQEDVDARFFDADNDGDQDLYVVSGGNQEAGEHALYQDRLYLNDGKGNFSTMSDLLPTIQSCGSTAVVYDYDQDGDLDVFRGGYVLGGQYPKAPRSYLLQNDGTGHFTDQTPEVLKAPGMVKTAAWGDINQNQKPDLILSGEWMPIRVFEFDGQAFIEITQSLKLEKTNGWWQTLSVIDINADGFPDIIAGNYGLNNQMKPTLQEPITIDAVDVEPNGSLDALISYYIQGKSYPLPTRDELFDQIPSLKARFTTYASYAEATISDILTPVQRTQALHLEAYEFRSGIFYGSKNGFSFSAFPNEVQATPIRSMLTEDINTDGKLDLIFCGNHYGARAQTGRLDAGSGFILHQGAKNTWSMHPASGFIGAGDARKLAKADQLWLVSFCHGPILGFQSIR